MTQAEYDRVVQEDYPAPETPVERFGRWLRRASVVGIAASLIVHAIILIITALIAIHRPGPAVAEPADSGFEFAVMTQAELNELENAALQLADPSVPEVPVPDPMAQEPLDSPDSADLLGVLDDLTDFGPTTGGGDIGDGPAIGTGGSGSGGASFFGVEAQGRRFAYIIDVSGSMAYGGKLQALRAALASSINNMIESGEFVVMLYSGTSWPLGGKLEWTEANDRGKRWAERLVAAIQASGSTNPSPAFAEIFGIRPRPDAIYFMTDGEFPEQVATEVGSLNRKLKIPIHCISFVSRQSEHVMRQIASDSGGTYTHVAGPGGP
ncbi:MAG: hypothetical protein H6811_11930 [Phycisphaeraceae bacterium]|nr:hypothetical protein [Phycisphaeraceae bacterium]